MSAHTPGPWKFREDSYVGIPYENPDHYLMINVSPGQERTAALANAVLIAAAPALLDALQAIAELCDATLFHDEGRGYTDDEAFKQCASLARAAIESATQGSAS